MTVYDIQELVDKTGIPRRTIYFYTQQGIIPPPQGAGLAARYTDQHRLRLLLVPVFRGEGRRLDEIRELLNRMSEEDMNGKLSQAENTPHSSFISGDHRSGLLKRSIIQYDLPKGVQIMVPANLTPEDIKKMDQIILWIEQQLSNPRPIQPI